MPFNQPLSRWIWTIVLVLALPLGAAAAVPAPAPNVPSARQEIEALIRRIESPAEREALIRQLKLLLEAQRGPAARVAEPSPFDNFFAEMMGAVGGAFRRNLVSFQALPAKLAEIPARWHAALSRQGGWEWEAGLRFLLALAVAVGFLVGARLLLHRLLPPPAGESAASGWAARLGNALREWLERALPPGALLAGGSLLVLLLGLGRTEERLLLILLWAIFLQRFLQGASAALLAPERPRWRPLPIPDETSAYLSLWLGRFILVGVWGEAVASACQALALGTELPQAVSHLYRLVLLLQVLAVVFQQRERVRQLISAREPEDAPSALRMAAGAWNLVAARWHLAAIPYFVAFYLFWTGGSRAGLRFLLEASAVTALTLAAAFGLSRLTRMGAARLFVVSDRLRALVPGIERRVNLYTPVITSSLVALIWALAVFVMLDAWGVPTLDVLLSESGLGLLGSLGGIAVTAAVAVGCIEGARAAVEHFLTGRKDAQGTSRPPSPQQRTLLPLALSVFKWAVIAAAAVNILANLGVNVGPILAGAGILGLAVGFGAQSLVKDIITGIFMLIENNIAVGDVVQVKGIGGFVEGFNLRSVRLRDYDGNVHVIPNGAIDVVTNFTKEFSQAVFDVGVAYRENVDEVIAVIREVAEEMRQDPEFGPMILEPVEIAGLDKFADSAVVIRGRFKTLPIKQWSVRREFYRRIKNTFDARGIEIPFPYRTLTWAEPKPPKAGEVPGGERPFPAGPGQPGQKEGS